MTPADVRAVLETMTDIPGVLAEADPMLKAEVYADLGLRMIYQPAQELVLVSAAPCVPQRVSEGRVEPNVNRLSCGGHWCARNGTGCTRPLSGCGARAWLPGFERSQAAARRTLSFDGLGGVGCGVSG
jgi:hypothetical protein